MEIKNLENIDLEKLVEVINLSFSDYIVPMQLDLGKLKSKIAAEDIQLKLSRGVFDGDKMLGCMLHGMRESNKGTVVYNGATGVIPDYRGKGLVGAMYQDLLPELKKLQVSKMMLEVIRGNHSAIKAYEKMGYNVDRTLDCYKGKIQVKEREQLASLIEIDSFAWSEFISFWDALPSWQNDIPSLENSKENCRIIAAYLDGLMVGYAIFNPTTRRVNQFAVAAAYREKGIGSQLFSYINEVVGQEEVYVYNVDDKVVSITIFLNGLGLDAATAQFEMSRTV